MNNQTATTHTQKSSRLTTVKGLRTKALKNIKKLCEFHENMDEFHEIKTKLMQKEKEKGANLSLSFYQDFYNLSLTDS